MGFGGGGGGASGKVSYPPYMETIHGQWLDHAGSDTPTYSVTDLLNEAWTNNPFTAVVGYDPDGALGVAEAKMVEFGDLNMTTELTHSLDRTLVLAAATIDADIVDLTTATSRINALLDAYGDQLDADIETKALPLFERGMQDINAVMSSAFVIGRALIIAERDRNLAKAGAELYIAAYKQRNEMIIQATEIQLKYFSTKVEYLRTIAHMAIEFARIKIVAKKEEFDAQMHVDESEAKWDIELYQHASNVLAGIAGGSHFVPNKPNKFASAIGGAISGAAMGTSIMPGYGTAIGAGVGGLLGLLQ